MNTARKYLTKQDEGDIFADIVIMMLVGGKDPAGPTKYLDEIMTKVDDIIAREVRKASQVPTDMVGQIKGAASAAADREAKIAAIAQKSIEDPLK